MRRTELHQLSATIQNKMNKLQGLMQHLSQYAAQAPHLDEAWLRDTLTRVHLSVPLYFSPLSALTWAPEKGQAIRIQQDQKTPQQKAPIPYKKGSTLEKIGDTLVLQENVAGERNNTKGRLIAEVPLSSVFQSRTFVVQEVVHHPLGAEAYSVPIPQTEAVFLLSVQSEPLWVLFLKEHFLSLLFFSFFSLGIASFFILAGRHFYALAVELLRQEIEDTQAENKILQKDLSAEQSENGQLVQKNRILVRTAQQREDLICDVLMRQRIMRQKAYLNTAVFLEEAGLGIDEEEFQLWIQDMNNHFGVPNVAPFQLRPVFDQVLSAFTSDIVENHIQVNVEDHMDTDLIKTDRLILSVVLANILNRCVLRFLRGGTLKITLSRKRSGFKITFLDNGHAASEKDFLVQASRHKFFFLEPDVLESLCASIGVKVTVKNKDSKDPENLNSILAEIPLKIVRVDASAQEDEVALPPNVLRFPKKRRKRPDIGRGA